MTEGVVNATETAQSVADDAVRHLRGVLAAGGLDAEVTVRSMSQDAVDIDVDGPDAGYLIGRRGQILDALQYLTLVITTHKRDDVRRVRINVDADGYRARRAESLRALAQELAVQVKETGEEAVIEPLTALERRIVHTALVDHADVETYSEGEEPNRYIVISPRK